MLSRRHSACNWLISVLAVMLATLAVSPGAATQAESQSSAAACDRRAVSFNGQLYRFVRLRPGTQRKLRRMAGIGQGRVVCPRTVSCDRSECIKRATKVLAVTPISRLSGISARRAVGRTHSPSLLYVLGAVCTNMRGQTFIRCLRDHDDDSPPPVELVPPVANLAAINGDVPLALARYCWGTPREEVCSDGPPYQQRLDLPIVIASSGARVPIRLGFVPSTVLVVIFPYGRFRRPVRVIRPPRAATFVVPIPDGLRLSSVVEVRTQLSEPATPRGDATYSFRITRLAE
jgi:hypothetical protein